MRRILGIVTGAVFGIAMVTHCGKGTNPTANMLDGGVDGISNANADTSTMLTGVCDKTAVHTQSNATVTSTSMGYYAEFMVTVDVKSAPHVTAIECDYEVFGTPTPVTCPMGYTCTDTDYQLPAKHCIQTVVTIAADRVLVACGARNQSTYPMTPANNTDTGFRWKNVYLRVD